MTIYYYVYKIIHKETNEFYIGRHVSNSLQDTYMGSGSSSMLKDKTKLLKEILFVYDDIEQMIQKEIQLIEENFDNPLCENMIIGDPTYGGVIKHSVSSKIKISEGLRRWRLQNPEWAATNDHKNSIRTSIRFRGIPHSDDHKQNASKARKGIPKSDDNKRALSESMKGKLCRPRESLCKSWIVTNILTNEVFYVNDRAKFCKDHNINYPCFNVGTRHGVLYKKTWLCEKDL